MREDHGSDGIVNSRGYWRSTQGAGKPTLGNPMIETIRGSLAVAFIAFNTVFWCLPVYLLGAVRPLLPSRWRVAVGTTMFRAVDGWVVCARWMATALGVVRVQTRVTAGKGMPLRPDGWYLVVCNHQSWADILVLTFALFGRIPQFKFFTKRELVWVPFIGVALWLLDFPLVRRYRSERLRADPALRQRDQQATRRACAGFRERPTSVLNFLEGTRFTVQKRDAQASPYARLLKPKIGGFATVLERMADRLDGVLDVTIVYPGTSAASPAPDFWQFLCGRCPTVQLEVRPLAPPTSDIAAVRNCVETLWAEKDARLMKD